MRHGALRTCLLGGYLFIKDLGNLHPSQHRKGHQIEIQSLRRNHHVCRPPRRTCRIHRNAANHPGNGAGVKRPSPVYVPEPWSGYVKNR